LAGLGATASNSTGGGRYPAAVVMPLAHAAAALLGGEAVHAEALGGGCLEQVTRIGLRDGRRVVAKGGPAPRLEAEMLDALRAAGVPAPRVLAVDDALLVMEERPHRGTPAGAWSDLGSVIATLHAAEGDRYGWHADYAYGPVALPNAPVETWPGFWGERRLLAHADRLPRDLARRVAALAADLPQRLPAHPRPSLLHGDLWGGNVLVDGDRVSALIDPACYFGHAEVDLAMLTLFDRPDARFFDVYPTEAGMRERRPVYQLWPAIVHLLLFGEAYRGMVERLLGEAGV
jgi:fructosamine-3-kinase